MTNWLAALLMGGGAFLVLTACFPGLYAPAQKALRFRAPKRLTQTQIILNELAEKIAPRLDLDPIKKSQTEMMLRNLGHTESPELFHAKAITQSAYFVVLSSISLLVSVPAGIAIMFFCGFWFYNHQTNSLERELAEKRVAIERELPQFASTICQSLGTTRDIVAILTSYRRVCGPALAQEIDKTLNDIMTGNPERAIHAFEGRVASPKLSQLTRGLLAVLRGDEQRQYFDVLAGEFRRAQEEAIERELLQRPQKLYPYMGILFLFLVLMIAASIGPDLVNSFRSIMG